MACNAEPANSLHYPTQSLVVSLMERDINSITDSVRRICRILALGSEIESIYKIHFSQQSMVAPSSATSVQHVGPSTCRALCESFLELCSAEPYVCDLPTVIRFTGYCRLLMQQTTQSQPNLETAQPENLSNLSETCDSSRDEMDGDDDEDDRMCLDEARDEFDCALLECDQRQLDDNWTDNKLYIDSDNR